MKKEYDLKNMKARPGKIKVDPNSASVMISMRIDAELLGKIREESKRLGIPYQALIKSVMHRYINGDFRDIEDKARMA